MTKRLTSHPLSDSLDALEPGDEVMIEGPHGSFTFTGEYNKVELLSGGIGITPLRSMIDTPLTKGWIQRSRWSIPIAPKTASHFEMIWRRCISRT